MSRKLLALTVVIAVVTQGLLLANAAEKKQTSTSLIQVKSKAKLSAMEKAELLLSDVKAEKAAKLGARRLSGAAQPPILFEDNFEGTFPTWITDASWNHVDTPIGRAFQDSSAWHWVDTNASSPTHSWHGAVALNEELDFVISPVIQLPESVVVAGIPSPLKGGKLSFMIDYDDPDADDSFSPLVGSATAWWHFDTSEPGAGTSSWRVDIPETGDADHHRQWLMTPPIDLSVPGVTAPVTLAFLHKYLSETDFDYYAVDVSTDDFRSYTNLLVFDGGPASSGGTVPGQPNWADTTADLSAYIGKVIRIRFSAKGDYGYTEPHAHWALDSITVSHAGGTLFSDDGGETGTTQMTKGGFLPGAILQNLQDLTPHPTPSWTAFEWEKNIFDGFNGQIGPGDSIRIGFRWNSDGDATPGRGIFIDDVVLTGIGKLAVDPATLGIANLGTAALGEPLNAKVRVLNDGLNPLTGRLTFTGTIKDAAGNIVARPAGFLNVTGFAPGQIVVIETLPGLQWRPAKPGNYSIEVMVTFPGDGDPDNNSAVAGFTVLGPPFAIPVYREDFEPRGGETTLEELGYEVVNGGGPQTWSFPNPGFGVYGGSAGLSWAWGTLEATGEPINEALITPPIDISRVGDHNTLFLNCYIYFRPGHPAVGPPFGIQKTKIDIDYTVDAGATWRRVWSWADNDALPGDQNRWPRVPEGVPFQAKTEFDISGAVGHDQLQLRFTVTSDSAYIVGVFVDEIIVYQGIGAARLTEVSDIPADQGKQVRVGWIASFNDLTLYDKSFGPGRPTVFPYGDRPLPVTFYALWRREMGSSAAGAGDSDALPVKHVMDRRSLLEQAHKAKLGDRFVVDASGEVWDFIAQIPAHDDSAYSYVAPTLHDRVNTAFFVSAHTSDPFVFADSRPAVGQSIDNLASGPPVNVQVIAEDSNARLRWEAPEEPDVRIYNIYRSTTSGQYPPTPLAQTSELTYLDNTVQREIRYYYVITATDYGDNESVRSQEVTFRVTSVQDKGVAAIPTSYDLAQNYPNPFNPETVIRYQLPEAGRVSLRVFNLLGQPIRTLIDGEKMPGYYTAVWDGRDDSGRLVPSGVYVYRFDAGSYSEMKKLVLMK